MSGRENDYDIEDATLMNNIQVAYRNENWPVCIKLCRQAIERGNKSTSFETYKVEIKLAFALLEERGDRSRNYEESIAVYQRLIEKESRHSGRWVSLQRNLGYAFSGRIEGNRDGNLKESIYHYESALSGMKHTSEPAIKASIQAELGHALMEIKSGQRNESIENAKRYFLSALRCFNAAEYPEEFGEISEALRSIEAETDS